jgi:cadmium resistance protein CadD (predicted permease)
MTAGAFVVQVGIGAAAFATTNLDGLLLLMALYAHGGFGRRAVALGQALGMAALVLASLAGAAGASMAPARWVPWLGLAPLALGVRGLLTAAPAGAGVAATADGIPGGAGRTLAVTGLAMASGGDNLGVYIPLFANAPGAVPLYVAVFAVMTAAWLWLARQLAASAQGRARIGAFARVALPLVLTALGARLLAGAAA